MIKNINANNRPDFIFKTICDLDLQRYIAIAMPFFALHSKTATISSVGIGLYQVYTLWNTSQSQNVPGNKWKDVALLVSFTAFGHFCPLTKLALSSVLFLGTHLRKMHTAYGWQNKGIILLQITSQAIYVSSTYYGTPALIVLSLLSQSFDEIFQAYQQYQKNKKPEMIASILLSSIRLYKASAYIPIEYSLEKIFKTAPHKNLEPHHSESIEEEEGHINFEYQKKLNEKIQSISFDSELFATKSDSQNQVSISKIIQSTVVPLYKDPLPQSSMEDDQSYIKYLDSVNKKTSLARWYHGALHSARVALWTQVLRRVYEKVGREKIDHPILLAIAGALHDVARQDEGPDYWDTQSSIALESLLARAKINEATRSIYTQAIRDKDPKDGFTTDVQRIVHDADCLDIMRIYNRDEFIEKNLCFYHFDSRQTVFDKARELASWFASFLELVKKQKSFYEKLIDEVASFINLTELSKIHKYLEIHSEDLYGDLVRLLFAMRSKFPLTTQLINNDMQEILKTPETKTSKQVLEFLKS